MRKIKWFKIADSAADIHFQTNNLAIAEADGKKITLALLQNKIMACAHKCPHAGGILADGFMDGSGNIVCPLHRYRFNPENGRNVTGEGYYLKTYPVETREDGVYIGFEEKGLLSWL